MNFVGRLNRKTFVDTLRNLKGRCTTLVVNMKGKNQEHGILKTVGEAKQTQIQNEIKNDPLNVRSFFKE